MSESTALTGWWATPSERALDCAQDHLERLGYRVLARQFGDCDLIAGRWPLVIACQVRAHRNIQPVADDERSVDRWRLCLSASTWLARPQDRRVRDPAVVRELLGLDGHRPAKVMVPLHPGATVEPEVWSRGYDRDRDQPTG
jgi:Holliday junction resolvase-like predicted endonuclease